ncbi:MAG: formyltransferase family protein [Deltaproteobacteria bacterium]|nr:formyltransferase family protein [Deltaproteobacteria bacterium]
MKVVLFANNHVGANIAQAIVDAGDEIIGLVLHSEDRRRCGGEIIANAKLDLSQVIDGTTLRDPAVVARVADMRADIGVSAFFGYILRKNIIDAFPMGVINVHPALLPYNRGSYPNVWSIVDETPAGVTVHYIDEGVDTGDIILQREVQVTATDTGETLYRKLEEVSVSLFKESWTNLQHQDHQRRPQQSGGTSHKLRDVAAIDEIDLTRSYTGRELINILRARTFPGYRGAYFIKDGRRVYLELSLRYEDDGATQ